MIYIDKQVLLDEACQKIFESPWAAIDTEADSLHHYIEKFCLLQISIANEDYVIDPLSGIDLTRLAEILSQKHLILHAASFDIRLIARRYPVFRPRVVFDTMIGAQLLNYDGHGLADLAKRHCNVALSKSSQKADWSERPLNDKLLTYAMNDTHYLHAIYTAMQDELVALGRLDWHKETCARMLESALEVRSQSLNSDTTCQNLRTDSNEYAWQIKGCKSLSPPGLSILKKLWQWREKEASDKDKPPFKILNADYLLSIAAWYEKNAGQDVATMPKAPRNIKGEHRDVLNRILSEVNLSHTEPYVGSAKRGGKPSPRLNAKQKQSFDKLREARQAIAESLKLHPSLVATNATLETIIVKSPKTTEDLAKLECLMNWQIEIAGEKFLKALM